MTEQHHTITEQIEMRIAEYKQKYYKDPTHVVMSLPVHSVMMNDLGACKSDALHARLYSSHLGQGGGAGFHTILNILTIKGSR